MSFRRLRRLEATQQEIRHQLDTIVTALIVSEPRTGLAAEAFDGLRRNVAFAAQERRRQLAQLVAFVDAIERGATIDTLRERCAQWCGEAGLRRVTEPAKPDWFEVVEGEGPVLEVVEPAWVDAANEVLVRPGIARRRRADVTPAQAPPADPPESADSAEPTTPPADDPPERAGGPGSEQERVA